MNFHMTTIIIIGFKGREREEYSYIYAQVRDNRKAKICFVACVFTTEKKMLMMNLSFKVFSHAGSHIFFTFTFFLKSVFRNFNLLKFQNIMQVP